MVDVFISYATADRDRVRPLVDELESRGYSVWWDRQISPGTAFDEAIEQALDDARWVISIWTEESITSRWVRAESMSALDRDALLPVLLDDVTPPVAFRTTQAADLRDWTPGEPHEGLSQLFARLDGESFVAARAPKNGESPSARYRGIALAVSLAVAITGMLIYWLSVKQDLSVLALSDYAGMPSVGVLPFEHADSADERLLADGLTNDIIQGLQQYRSFPVMSRHATFAFRDTQLSIAEVADRLGTQYLVTGNVRRAGDAIRVSVDLTTEAGQQVWSETYETKFEAAAIFAVQDEIAGQILGVMYPQIVVSEISRVDDQDPTDLEAWGHVLIALDVVYQLDMNRVEEAQQHIEAALALDPNQALAYWARGELGVYDYTEDGLLGDAATLREQAIIADFNEALEISPFDGSICGCLAFAHMMLGDMPAARAVLDSALAVNPSNAVLRLNHGMFLLHQGDVRGAKSEVEVALRLDPISRFGSMGWATLGQIAAVEGDLETAITYTRRGLQLERRESFSQIQLPTLLLLHQESARAQNAFAELIDSHPNLHPHNRFTYGWIAPLEKQIRAHAELQGHAGSENTTLGELLEQQWRDLGWRGA